MAARSWAEICCCCCRCCCCCSCSWSCRCRRCCCCCCRCCCSRYARPFPLIQPPPPPPPPTAAAAAVGAATAGSASHRVSKPFNNPSAEIAGEGRRERGPLGGDGRGDTSLLPPPLAIADPTTSTSSSSSRLPLVVLVSGRGPWGNTTSCPPSLPRSNSSASSLKLIPRVSTRHSLSSASSIKAFQHLSDDKLDRCPNTNNDRLALVNPTFIRL